jgi:2-C-methyl-D-erythritol 4-phosphate cytidylyltransferase
MSPFVMQEGKQVEVILNAQQEKNRVSVIIAAAGSGSRMNMDRSKQYIEINGIPVLSRTIQAFEDCGAVDEIILVVNRDDISYCRQNIVDAYRFKKVKAVVPGGAVRQESVLNGLRQAEGTCDVVLIHDGARPFINSESIVNCIKAADEFGSACTAVRVKDTVKSADEGGMVRQTLDRRELWSVQTPQAFKYDIIMKAHESAQRDGFCGTDDAVLVERLGYSLKIVEGSYYNIKITTREDLVFAKAIACLYEN